MKKFIQLLLGSTLLLISCATTIEKPQNEEASEFVALTGPAFVSQAKDYLSLPTDYRFIQYINQHGKEFPEQTRQLWELYAGNQEKLLIHYMEEGDLFKAEFYHNNLLAAQTLSPGEIQAFHQLLAKYLKINGYSASVKYMQMQWGVDTGDKPLYAPLSSITRYNEILAEIHVERSYKGPMDIIRKDYPPVMGSGFLISPKHVLTAYHVIEHIFWDETTDFNIVVIFGQEVIRDAKIIAWDSLTDMAVIELPEERKMPQEFYKLLGNSKKLKQGFTVYCLGHHLGLSSTLTRGIISSTQRKAPEVGDWIQVDANVAPGASGGLVIGEDNLIYGMILAGYIYNDINFAVPSNLIISILDRLEKSENIRHPWLGLILEQDRGKNQQISILDIFPSSPLKELDVQAGDIITEINHQPLDSVNQAQNLLISLDAGNLIQIKILKKDNQQQEYWVHLARRPDQAIYNATRQYNKLSSLYPHFGFKLDNARMVSHTLINNGKEWSVNFYRVIEIREDSFLDDMGVKVGDLLGILEDTFKEHNRYLTVLQIPAGISWEEFDKRDDIKQFIFRMEKGAYDANIL